MKIEIIEGDTIGSCLMRAGVVTLRKSFTGEPRGLYCVIGICSDCIVSVNGVHNVCACVTKAEPGAVVDLNEVGK